MALDSNNCDSALTGALYSAPMGTTAPIDAVGAWDAGWDDLGYVGDEGVVEADAREWNTIRAWQNRAIVRQLMTEQTVTLACTLIENKREVLELRHPGSTMTSATSTHTLNVMAPTQNRRAFGLDIVDLPKHERIIVPIGEVSEVGDISYVNGELIGYPITITCYPSSSGLTMIKISDMPAWAAA
jgi:hypothetical protein